MSKAIKHGWCTDGTVTNIRGEAFRRGDCSCGRDGVRVTKAGKAYRHTKSGMSREEWASWREMLSKWEAEQLAR